YYATTLRMSVRNTMYAIAVLATMSVATYRALDFYFAGKLSAYSEYQAAGQFSGLSDLLVITTVITGALLSSLDRRGRLTFVVITGAAAVGAFFLARKTVAGTRVLDLLVVMAPVALLVMHTKQ